MKIQDEDIEFIYTALEIAIRDEGDLLSSFLENPEEWGEEIPKCKQRIAAWERLQRRFKT